MLPVTELIFTAWQLLAQRNQTEPQNKSCLKSPFSLKPDPDLSHQSQVFLNLDWNQTKTFTGLQLGPLSLKPVIIIHLFTQVLTGF